MIGRVIRALITTAVTLALIVAVVYGVLKVTNAKPTSSEGWTRLADMPQPRGEVASANVGARVVIAGGLYGVGQTSDAVHVYEIERDKWSRGKPLPSRRHHSAAAALGDFVYVAGGAESATDWEPAATVWRARLGEVWRRRAPMPEGRQGHAMVALGGRLYVVGGVGRSNDTLIYDAKKDAWTTGAPIPDGRDHLRAVAWRKKVWVLGGRDADLSRGVDVYDPKTDGWTRGPDLPIGMSAMAVGVLGDRLYVIGGEDPGLRGGRVIQQHYVLGRGSRRWRSASRPVLAVHGAGYAAFGDRLFMAGGASRPGVLSIASWTDVTQVFSPGFSSN
jgi:N-acetylneuraminic acid mutarotase